MPATTTGPEGAGCAQDSRARSLVREQSVLDRQAVGEAADGAVGAQHSMARDEGRQQVARARSAGSPNRAGSPGPRGELRVADGGPGRDVAHRAPHVLEERAAIPVSYTHLR